MVLTPEELDRLMADSIYLEPPKPTATTTTQNKSATPVDTKQESIYLAPPVVAPISTPVVNQPKIATPPIDVSNPLVIPANDTSIYLTPPTTVETKPVETKSESSIYLAPPTTNPIVSEPVKQTESPVVNPILPSINEGDGITSTILPTYVPEPVYTPVTPSGETDKLAESTEQQPIITEQPIVENSKPLLQKELESTRPVEINEGSGVTSTVDVPVYESGTSSLKEETIQNVEISEGDGTTSTVDIGTKLTDIEINDQSAAINIVQKQIATEAEKIADGIVPLTQLEIERLTEANKALTEYNSKAEKLTADTQIALKELANSESQKFNEQFKQELSNYKDLIDQRRNEIISGRTADGSDADRQVTLQLFNNEIDEYNRFIEELQSGNFSNYSTSKIQSLINSLNQFEKDFNAKQTGVISSVQRILDEDIGNIRYQYRDVLELPQERIDVTNKLAEFYSRPEYKEFIASVQSFVPKLQAYQDRIAVADLAAPSISLGETDLFALREEQRLADINYRAIQLQAQQQAEVNIAKAQQLLNTVAKGGLTSYESYDKVIKDLKDLNIEVTPEVNRFLLDMIAGEKTETSAAQRELAEQQTRLQENIAQTKTVISQGQTATTDKENIDFLKEWETTPVSFGDITRLASKYNLDRSAILGDRQFITQGELATIDAKLALTQKQAELTVALDNQLKAGIPIDQALRNIEESKITTNITQSTQPIIGVAQPTDKTPDSIVKTTKDFAITAVTGPFTKVGVPGTEDEITGQPKSVLGTVEQIFGYGGNIELPLPGRNFTLRELSEKLTGAALTVVAKDPQYASGAVKLQQRADIIDALDRDITITKPEMAQLYNTINDPRASVTDKQEALNRIYEINEQYSEAIAEIEKIDPGFGGQVVELLAPRGVLDALLVLSPELILKPAISGAKLTVRGVKSVTPTISSQISKGLVTIPKYTQNTVVALTDVIKIRPVVVSTGADILNLIKSGQKLPTTISKSVDLQADALRGVGRVDLGIDTAREINFLDSAANFAKDITRPVREYVTPSAKFVKDVTGKVIVERPIPLVEDISGLAARTKSGLQSAVDYVTPSKIEATGKSRINDLLIPEFRQYQFTKRIPLVEDIKSVTSKGVEKLGEIADPITAAIIDAKSGIKTTLTEATEDVGAVASEILYPVRTQEKLGEVVIGGTEKVTGGIETGTKAAIREFTPVTVIDEVKSGARLVEDLPIYSDVETGILGKTEVIKPTVEIKTKTTLPIVQRIETGIGKGVQTVEKLEQRTVDTVLDAAEAAKSKLQDAIASDNLDTFGNLGVDEARGIGLSTDAPRFSFVPVQQKLSTAGKKTISFVAQTPGSIKSGIQDFTTSVRRIPRDIEIQAFFDRTGKGIIVGGQDVKPFSDEFYRQASRTKSEVVRTQPFTPQVKRKSLVQVEEDTRKLATEVEFPFGDILLSTDKSFLPGTFGDEGLSVERLGTRSSEFGFGKYQEFGLPRTTRKLTDEELKLLEREELIRREIRPTEIGKIQNLDEIEPFAYSQIRLPVEFNATELTRITAGAAQPLRWYEPVPFIQPIKYPNKILPFTLPEPKRQPSLVPTKTPERVIPSRRIEILPPAITPTRRLDTEIRTIPERQILPTTIPDISTNRQIRATPRTYELPDLELAYVGGGADRNLTVFNEPISPMEIGAQPKIYIAPTARPISDLELEDLFASKTAQQINQDAGLNADANTGNGLDLGVDIDSGLDLGSQLDSGTKIGGDTELVPGTELPRDVNQSPITQPPQQIVRESIFEPELIPSPLPKLKESPAPKDPIKAKTPTDKVPKATIELDINKKKLEEKKERTGNIYLMRRTDFGRTNWNLVQQNKDNTVSVLKNWGPFNVREILGSAILSNEGKKRLARAFRTTGDIKTQGDDLLISLIALGQVSFNDVTSELPWTPKIPEAVFNG